MADTLPVLKADKDYSKDADKLIPEAESLAKSNLQGAIDKLLGLEKQTRQASDLPSTNRIITSIVTLCKDHKDWGLLNEQVLLISKKHGQLKQAVTKMVQVVMAFLDEAPNMETKLQAIETLRTVTEGKIFVEVERARVTKILSNIKKEQGDIKAATDILCELQVETFGSMSRREKTDFILEQVSLCIQNGDWTQAGILSRKISTKYLSRRPAKPKEQLEKEAKEKESKEKKRLNDLGPAGVDVKDATAVGEEAAPADDDITDLRLRYYEQQITLSKHDDKYLDACKYWRQVLDTEAVEQDPEKLKASLQHVIHFVILAPYDNEQSDLLERIHRDSRNSTIPQEAELLKHFTKPEIMRWPSISQEFGPHLCSSDTFSAEKPTNASKESEEAKAHQRWQDLRKRVIEHNVRVIAKYYTRIQFARLTELLDLSADETEKYISELVVSKTIYAKIDRPARLVSFNKPKDADDVLNEWSGNMKSLLGLLELCDHQISKEVAMNALTIKSGAKGKAAAV